jgi:hypothetical protein
VSPSKAKAKTKAKTKATTWAWVHYEGCERYMQVIHPTQARRRLCVTFDDVAAAQQSLDAVNDAILRRLLELRRKKYGHREYIQVLRLLETFALWEVTGAIEDALRTDP